MPFAANGPFPPATRRYGTAAARPETSRGNPESGIPAEIIPRGQARAAIDDSLRKHAELRDLHGHASMRPGQLAVQIGRDPVHPVMALSYVPSGSALVLRAR